MIDSCIDVSNTGDPALHARARILVRVRIEVVGVVGGGRATVPRFVVVLLVVLLLVVASCCS